MCEYDFISRDFEELDEKLPMIAKIIVNRGIDFRQLEKKSNSDAAKSIFLIMRENLECMSEMTADEVEVALDSMHIACEIVLLINSGDVKINENKITLKC